MPADDFDPIAEFNRAMNTSERKVSVLKTLPKSDADSDSDTRINVRINSALKAEFESLCKREHSTVSSEIKRFIVQALKRNSLS